MTLGFDETLSRLEGELFSDSTVMAVPHVPDAVDAPAEVGHTHLQERQEKVFKYIKRSYYI